jgi:hypothetical protein
MSPTDNLLLILIGGPVVMGGTFLVARALVLRDSNQSIERDAAVPARPAETARPPRRKESAR